MSAIMSETLLDELLVKLRERKSSVGFAESCTGGLLSATVAARAGVSDVYMGAIVSYANHVKQNLLGVSADSLSKYGAVSEVVACEMAQGARRALKCEMSIAITGIAGPSGGTPDKPVGTVCIAVAGPNFERVETKRFQGDRQSIQRQAMQFALKFLVEQLI